MTTAAAASIEVRCCLAVFPASRSRPAAATVVTVVLAIVLVAATSAAFLAAPKHATSEEGGVHLNVTPFVGYGDWAKEINLDNKAYFGGRLGLGVGRYLGVEGYYGWLGTHTEYGKRTLAQLVEGAVKHLDHHIGFIHKKRAAMGKEMW